MPQIYIMAAITFSLALFLWGGLIYLFTGHQKCYFWLLLLGLPLSAIGNLVLKPQALIVVGQAAHVQPGLGLAAPAWFLAFKVALSPLVEEVTKIAPMLLKPARRMVTGKTRAFWVGFALGVSFGLGEALFIAYAVAQNPAYGSLPWYAFTGYMNERLMTFFAHGVLTAVLMIGLQRGGRYILFGYLAALALHLFLNAPTVFYQFQWLPYEIYNFTLVIPFIVLAVIFERLRRRMRQPDDEHYAREVVFWKQ